MPAPTMAATPMKAACRTLSVAVAGAEGSVIGADRSGGATRRASTVRWA